jgi:hypothetical protein
MPHFRFMFAALALGLGVAHGQPCLTQAKRTIEQAVRVAGAGDLTGARRLLDRAERECPTSFSVYRDLAKLYKDWGDVQNADRCEDMANRLDPRRPPPEPLSEQEKSFVREKWALVVGIGRFQRPEIPRLEFAAKDASDIARALTDPEIGRFRDDNAHVRVLTDDQATLANLRAEINYITKNARDEDLVVFYLSSHGTSPAADAAARADAQTGYIVTYDTDTTNLYGTAFPMDELKRVVVDRVRARRVVTFLDTCFSGDTVRWAKGGKALTVIPAASFQGVAQGTGRVVVVSSQGTEQSWEGNGNSYFTRCLIEALRLKNGLPTITEVYTHLSRTVPYLVKKEKNASQYPQMWPEGRKLDIVIGTPVQ